MDAHGVSRTVVREAISRLQAAGQVETRHGIGTFVLDTPSPSGFRIDPATVVTLRDVLAILELRISLEVESAGLAALRRSDEQLAAMRAALDALNEGAAHASDAVASDFQFHLQIALSTGNRYFTDIMTHLGTSIIPRTRLNSARLAHDDQQHYMNRLGREHEEIYEAIARQDSDAARAAMRLHLTNSRERLRQAHEEVEDLRLGGHVQRRGRFVGDQQVRIEGQGHGDHHPLALTAGQFERISLAQPQRVRQADITEQIDHPLLTHPGRTLTMGTQGFIDLPTHAQQWIERTHRLLEHHTEGPAAQLAHPLLVAPGQVLAAKTQAATLDVQGRRQQAQQRLGQHRLAGTRLTDQAQALPRRQRQRQVIQRMAAVGPRGQGDTQLLDAQQGCALRAHEFAP